MKKDPRTCPRSLVNNETSLVKENVDLEALLQVAQNARPLALSDTQKAQIVIDSHKCAADKVKLGIVRDKAFSFYYPENIEALEEAGAELITVDALHDSKLPDDICGLYIGGGFPEVMAEEISANTSLLEDIKAKADAEFPIYAECGGLMFLSRNIIDGETVYPMTGIFDCDVEMTAKPQGIGYTIQRVLSGNPFYAEGDTVIGHEFHNSRVVNMGEGLQYGFATERGKCIKPGFDALVYKNTMAGYHHLHVYGAPEWADNFCRLARTWKEKGLKR